MLSSSLVLRLLHSLVLVCGLCVLCRPALPQNQAGAFDTTFFGTGARINIDFSSRDDQLSAMLLQPDGLILLAGTCTGSGQKHFCLTRLQGTGSYDLTFNGPSPGSIPAGGGRFLLPIGSQNFETLHSMALQINGRILVAGQCRDGAHDHFCYARLMPDSSLDSGFGFGGKDILIMGSGGHAAAHTVLVQPDQKIVLVGTCNSSGNRICVARLLPNGNLDTSFGTGGRVILLSLSVPSGSIVKAALQPDGKIVFAFGCQGASADFCIGRLNADGSADSSWVGPSGSSIATGVIRLDIGASTDDPNAIALQPDGKVLLAGRCDTTSSFLCFVRLLSNGDWDTTFGSVLVKNGKRILDAAWTQSQAFAVKVTPDGKILSAGLCDADDLCLIRMQDDGALDTNFLGPTLPNSNPGRFLLPMGTFTDEGRDILLQPDGKILVAGHCGNGSNYDFCIARLRGGPFGARQCSLDVDGDGQVLATKDMLILTRVVLGMSGPAVINGINLTGAPRSTWASIRDYLVRQCDMVIP